MISCGARLAPFDIAELREIMSYDEMELDKIGDRKTALFLIMSDTDTTFNFVIAMLQSQLFNLLCDKADDEYGGRLPVHVRVIADEFANIGQIPQFDKLIATIRSREISASIILQSQSQLKAMYKDSADTILGNCDNLTNEKPEVPETPNTPDTPQSHEETKVSNAPKTGDSTNIWLPILLLIISTGGMAGLYISRKRKNK